jgi:hypothetical protein
MRVVPSERFKVLIARLDPNKRCHSTESLVVSLVKAASLEGAYDFKPYKSTWRKFKEHSPFWYSLGSEWLEFDYYDWHTGKMPRFVYEVKIDLSKIKVLQTPLDARQFTRRFGLEERVLGGHVLRWGDISKYWSGLEISSKVARRLHLDSHCSWINAWDVGSGVIWDVSAVTSLDLVIDLEKEGNI